MNSHLTVSVAPLAPDDIPRVRLVFNTDQGRAFFDFNCDEARRIAENIRYTANRSELEDIPEKEKT